MKTWNHVAVAAAVAAAIAAVSTAAVAADPVCRTQPERKPSVHARRTGDPHMPRVRIQHPRCPAAPAPVHKDAGCDDQARARAPNPPPPEGTEPAFGEVPVAAVVPPSAPYSGQVPPGPAQARRQGKPGCGSHPAS